MNLDGDNDFEQPTANERKTKKPRKTYVCKHPFCLKKGHATTKSKKCLANPERLAREGLEQACAEVVAAAGISVATVPANNNNDAVDIAMIDSAPLDDPLSDDSALYVDATAFSEDDEGNINITNANI